MSDRIGYPSADYSDRTIAYQPLPVYGDEELIHSPTVSIAYVQMCAQSISETVDSPTVRGVPD